MELRHLRYFVAVAETQSLTLAAKARLHTSQPSLSRQIRDLEEEVGAPLLTRGARGIELKIGQRAGVGFFGGEDGVCEPGQRGDFVNCLNPVIRGITTDGG